jgi:hypothetical protein
MASEKTLYRRMAAEVDEERAEAHRPAHPCAGRPQSSTLQAVLMREFLAAYDRAPILTPRVLRATNFAKFVARKYPSARKFLFSAPTPAVQKRRETSLPPPAAASSEIESEAPT